MTARRSSGSPKPSQNMSSTLFRPRGLGHRSLLGFGTTLVVAERLGRHAAGCEAGERRAAFSAARLGLPDRVVHGREIFPLREDLVRVNTDGAEAGPGYDHSHVLVFDVPLTGPQHGTVPRLIE